MCTICNSEVGGLYKINASTMVCPKCNTRQPEVWITVKYVWKVPFRFQYTHVFNPIEPYRCIKCSTLATFIDFFCSDFTVHKPVKANPEKQKPQSRFSAVEV